MTLEQILISSGSISQDLSTRLYEFDALCNRVSALTAMENTTMASDGVFAETTSAIKKNMLLRKFEEEAREILGLMGAEDNDTNTDLLQYFSGRLENIYKNLKINTKLQLGIIADINRILSLQELQELPESCH